MKNIFKLFFTLFTFSANAQNNYLLAGTYTTGKSEGIYVYEFNSVSGDATYVSKVRTVNPSYIDVSPDEQFVYAVNEEGNGKGGKIAAYSFTKKNGALTFINEQPSGGDDPCFAAVDATGKWVAVANYSGGSLSIFPVQTDGRLGAAVTHIQDTGTSINKERQEKAHVHSAFFSKDNRHLLVQDLGTDKIMIYAFDDRTGKLRSAKQPFVNTVPGSGPRHIAFSSNNRYVYVMHELNGSVGVYSYKKGKLRSLQNISAAEPGFTGFMGSADIHVSPDGEFLYCSNRGDANNITIFKINKKKGTLSVTGYQPALGIGPRNFNFDPSGNFLLVANQKSNDIIIFRINKTTGLLTDTGKKIEIDEPVCIKWITGN